MRFRSKSGISKWEVEVGKNERDFGSEVNGDVEKGSRNRKWKWEVEVERGNGKISGLESRNGRWE